MAFVLISLAVVLPYINTLQTENDLYRISLQSSISEKQQLLDEKAKLVKWIKKLNNTNQKLNEEKEDLQNEIKQTNADFSALLEDKKELEIEFNQTNAELHSIYDENTKLLVERKKLKDNAQSLLKEKEGLQNETARLKIEIQLANERLLENIESLRKNADDHNVYGHQVWYIGKWMNFIEQLEERIDAIITYSIELQNNEVMVKGIDLLLKFTKECKKYLDALSLNKIEEMKNLQANSDMEKPKQKIEEFKEFANRHQNVHQNEGTMINVDAHQKKQDSLEVVSTLVSVGSWIWYGLSWLIALLLL